MIHANPAQGSGASPVGPRRCRTTAQTAGTSSIISG